MGERIEIGVERCGAPEDLRISHPAQPFISLRAVGWHAFEVAALAPKDVVPQPVHSRISGVKLDGFRGVGMEYQALDGFARGYSRKAGHFNIAEAVVSEMRLKGFCASASQNEGISLLRCSHVVPIELALRIEHFAKAHLDSGSTWALHMEPRPSNHVLAHIEYEDSGCWAGHGDGVQCLCDSDRLEVLSGDLCLGTRHDLDWAPVSVGIGRLSPAWFFQPGIVNLPVVDFGAKDRGGCCLPGFIADNRGARAVDIGEFQLGEEAGGRRSIVEPAVHGEEPRGIPPVSQESADRVVPLVEAGGNVIRLIDDLLAVIGPAGSQNLIANRLAVQAKLIAAERCGVEPGGADLLRNKKGIAQQACWVRRPRTP